MSLRSALAAAAWIGSSAAGDRKFSSALEDPSRAQRHVLARYLGMNAETEIGRRYRFRDIRSVKEYQDRVPISAYPDYADAIGRIAHGHRNVLTRQAVRRLAVSSGSTSAAKHIPCTPSLLQEFRRAISPWVVDLFRRHPGAMLGAAYWSISPVAVEAAARPPTMAVPVGFEDDSDYLGGAMKWLVGSAFAVPSEVRYLRDLETFRYVTLLHLLARRDLSFISIWHPSFLTLLLDELPECWPMLIEDIRRGSLLGAPDVPSHLVRRLRPRAEAARARQLSRLRPDDYTNIWPRLSLVSAWGDAHAAVALDDLRRRLPAVHVQPKGLLATEGVVTVPYLDATPVAVRSHFYEFVDGSTLHLAHELEAGREYSVLLTTGGGLYRYQLDDRVEVTAYVASTPSLRFLGKTDHVSDLCGEKLAEAFVADSLSRVFARLELRPKFALLAPDTRTSPAGYVLYLEHDRQAFAALASAVDQALRANPHYDYCRYLRQLAPVRVVQRNSLYAAYLARCQQRGQRPGDVKPLALSALKEWPEVFESSTCDGRRASSRDSRASDAYNSGSS